MEPSPKETNDDPFFTKDNVRITNYKDNIDRSDYNRISQVMVKTKSGKLAESKNDKNITSARLSLRRKIENDPTGRLQTKYARRATKLIPNRRVRKYARRALKKVNRVKATAVNTFIFSWATPMWFFLHLPLAVISLALFGATYFFNDYLSGVADKAGIVGKGIYTLASWVGKSVNWVLDSLFGLSTNPADVFLAVNSAVFFLGFTVLFIMIIQYALAGISCFLGRGSVFKLLAFIIAVFGYMLPLFNIFPWFMLWAWAVNINPE